MKPILDMCCGSRMFYFDKTNPNVHYCDIREGTYKHSDRDMERITVVEPDTIADFRALPFDANSFYQVIFDPPHLKYAGEKLYVLEFPRQLNTYVAKVNSNGVITHYSPEIYDALRLTGKEIKAIDERYWPFAVPVDEVTE